MAVAEVVEIGLEAANDVGVSGGTARVRALRLAERGKNALRRLGLFWGLGLLCVLLPLVHFVLVPLFLLLGLYFALATASVERFVVSGSVSCPECRKPFLLTPAPEHWPLEQLCAGCRHHFKISPGDR